MKKVYILPNLFTTGNFFCGILAFAWILQGKYLPAGISIMLAMIFDFVDGQVARLAKAGSRFGVEYDSLADFLTFGIASAALAYRLVLENMGRFGIGIIFLYTVFAALRLARYNTHAVIDEKSDFSGLPCPVSAGVLVSFCLIVNRYQLEWLGKIIPVLMILLGALMVSNFPYPGMVRFKFHMKRPFLYLVAIMLALVVLVFLPEIGAFLGFSSYAAYGVYCAWRLRMKKKKTLPEPGFTGRSS
jgi:CDP-diacylglycerol--serine O-phosphatidyltransferase